MKCKSENVSSFVEIIYISKKQFATIAKSILCKKKIDILSEEFWILHLFSIWFGFLFLVINFDELPSRWRYDLNANDFPKVFEYFFPLNIYSFFLVRPLKVILWTFFSVWKRLFFEERFALRISTLGTKKFELENGHLLNKTKMKEKIWKI